MYASSTQGGASMRRLRMLSSAMLWLITGGAVATVVCMAWIWFGLPDWELGNIVREITHADSAVPVSLSLAHRAGGFLSTGIALGLLICALYQARQMFAAFGRGEVLTAHTALRLRGMALALTALGLSIPLVRLLTGLAMVGSPAEPYWVLIFTLGDYFVSLLGGLLMAIAWAITEAICIAEENKSFI
ncbi:DUF2975 domain-containing protein [Burkholderia diffusa]|uniref:DUF2975 domain-containing protein n=2 Tax=Burkholderia diffusa TaxID=488732 RepID=UPI002ABE7196|nr:DUF2975 domain-containing protein [Burkholderia diffusa]